MEKSLFHKDPEVDYTIPPNDRLPDSSCFIENAVLDIPACRRTIYKPNNPSFSTEASVQSSTYTDRVKYNTIKKNNESFNKTYHVKFEYSPDPVYFVKNKTALKCYSGKCVNLSAMWL
jgi:hypothetical protein